MRIEELLHSRSTAQLCSHTNLPRRGEEYYYYHYTGEKQALLGDCIRYPVHRTDTPIKKNSRYPAVSRDDPASIRFGVYDHEDARGGWREGTSRQPRDDRPRAR